MGPSRLAILLSAIFERKRSGERSFNLPAGLFLLLFVICSVDIPAAGSIISLAWMQLVLLLCFPSLTFFSSNVTGTKGREIIALQSPSVYSCYKNFFMLYDAALAASVASKTLFVYSYCVFPCNPVQTKYKSSLYSSTETSPAG